MVCVTCFPINTQGSGYDEDGDKICTYSCTDAHGNSKQVEGGSQDFPKGDICYGYKVMERPTSSGDITTYSGPMSPFDVDTDSLIDEYLRYDSFFINNIESAFPQ